MTTKRCILIGIPTADGTGRLGCDMGPSAFRAAGIGTALADLGFEIIDRGNAVPGPTRALTHPNHAVRKVGEVAAWIETIDALAYEASGDGLPIFLGGDHSLSAGTLCGLSRRAATEGRPLFVLWLDSHPDFHTLETTTSGNLHGIPCAYATGLPGFERYLPPVPAPVDPTNICMIGLRSVDPPERRAIAEAGVTVHDMRAIDEHGIASLVETFLRRVAAAGGLLHVSLDVDFLDPEIAPGVGTTVPGGATFREAHLVMEMLHDSGLVRGLDLVELNPFLDNRGQTAFLLIDLAASLLGRRVLDRPTRRS